MGPDVEDNKWPPWLKPLLEEKFFDECKLHSGSPKNECNLFCLDCYYDPPLCSLCLPHHKDHPVIQNVYPFSHKCELGFFFKIRRSSYHDVIRVIEIQKYLDLTSVQTYVINSSKVVFLNKRPQLRPGKGVTNTCKVCDRGLLDNFRFCSLGCKIAGTSNNSVKNHCKTSVWDAGESYYSSGSSSNEHGPERTNIGNVQGFSPSTPLATAVNFKTSNRRKGIPRRAPTGGLIIEY